MRARLSAISNFTTSQLMAILQNWTANTSAIIVDGQLLTVTSVSFLSNDKFPIHPTSNNNADKKRFYSVESVLLVACHCFFVFVG